MAANTAEFINLFTIHSLFMAKYRWWNNQLFPMRAHPMALIWRSTNSIRLQFLLEAPSH